ncbi:MAG TPA: choice-of-anchor tandem repeat GloVer-containing protein [Tepidisphaeraceae bacterium]
MAGSISARGQYKLATLYEFTLNQGSFPGPLLFDSNGNLYGTTNGGGADHYGTAFEFSPSTQTLTTFVNFDITNGSQPNTSLVMDSMGNLYGMTEENSLGESELFELSAGTRAFSIPAVLQQPVNGLLPNGNLMIDAAGNIYGTAQVGGYNNLGTVFEISPGTGAANVLASFNLTDGERPSGGVVADAQGDLFGATNEGGPNRDGVVFEVPAGSHTPITLAAFNGANGKDSTSGLVMDSHGNLYGATPEGGDLTLNGGNGDGVVFEVAAGSSAISVLATFEGSNGAEPQSSLLIDSNGNLFGTTVASGADGRGTVFEIPAGTDSLLTLVNFDGHNGSGPEGSLIEDGDGNLYGTTTGNQDFQTGKNYTATIFELSLPEPTSLQWLIAAASLLRRRKRRQ